MERFLTKGAAALALVSMTAPAIAAPKMVIQPVQVGGESLRYDRGTPTVDLEGRDGVVQITPLALDHGSLSFGVAVFNDSDQPANLGIENIQVETGGKSLAVFSKDQLVGKAKNRAMWSQIGVAVLGGLGAAAAASQRNTYRSTFVTPSGVYRSYGSYPSIAGQIQANGIAIGTGISIAAIQDKLDRKRDELGQEIIQTTTVYPGESYAGRIVLAKIPKMKMPQQVTITVHWNGQAYPFAFQLAKPGTLAPAFAAITRSAPAPRPQPAFAPTARPHMPSPSPVPAMRREAPPAPLRMAQAEAPLPAARPVVQPRPAPAKPRQRKAVDMTEQVELVPGV